MNIKYKTTQELQIYVNEMYERVKPLAEKDGIYRPLSVHFDKSTPFNQQGSYCYADKYGYHYGGIGDRGEIFSEKNTKSLFEISYWIVKDQISSMAFDYELKNRIEGQDTRRIAFSKEIQLFGTIGEDFERIAVKDINRILKKNPYIDSLD